VKLQRDDWDEDERRALTGLEAELEEIRARHRDDPPFELLQAAHAEALPESLQGPVSEHLGKSAWSRALVEGAASAEPSLDAVGERRLLTQVLRSARETPSATHWWSRSWLPALAAAAVLILMVAIFRRGEPARPSDRTLPTPETQVASATPVAEFMLPLDKPDVKLTASALVLRSDGRGGTFVDEIAPALNAYRGNDYVAAERQFAALETRYPKSVEVAFYRAIARLFLNDGPGAIQSLQAARRLDDDTFAPEIAWYLAVAHQRAGQPSRARVELDALCKGPSSYASRACEAAQKIKPE
jgi:hypothetical protein